MIRYLIICVFTGLPKPAIINQTKAIGLSKSFLFFNFNENDIAYICTPLYHSAATVLGFFNTIDVGLYILTSLDLKQKFCKWHIVLQWNIHIEIALHKRL